MGGWGLVLFERKVLTWVVGLATIACLIWLSAVATPYWTVHVYHDHLRKVWSYRGVWKSCDLIDTNLTLFRGHSPDGEVPDEEPELYWECRHTWNSESEELRVLARSEMALTSAALLLAIISLVFSIYSLSHPKYIYKRLAASLHAMTAVCMLTVMQLFSSSIHHPDEDSGVESYHGISVLLGWSACITVTGSSIAFLMASRKRKLLDGDNYSEQTCPIKLHSNQ